ncbi:unnamed protein product [marine sediment metagenome]|uniref:Uncharacterized protein n=1 Tax=marine sediment metagenome TaxID=412755 RepID=X1AHM1_9ZZZZ
MSYAPGSDFYAEVAKGNVPGHSLIHKFGHYDSVGTSFVPLCSGGIYRTPQVAGATALRIKAGDVADDAAGVGAREVTIQGLDETGALVTEAVATAGVSASANTSATFIRFFRAWVSASGTYASQTAGSHAADIVIENAAGSEDWGTIEFAPFPKAQTEIGAYSVAIGVTAYLLSATVFSDTSKTTTVIFFQRTNILQTAAPYDGMRIVFDATVEGGATENKPKAPQGPFAGPCDLGFMGAVGVGSAGVTIDFELLLVED